jgi:ABC-type amino acid transport substrate-binding protein
MEETMRGFRGGAVLAAAMLLLAGGLAGCGSEPDAGDAPGTLVVGADVPYVPFAFGDAPNYQGMDMDLVREIARRLGKQTEIRKTPFDTIFRDLAQGKFDLVAASVTITDERKKVVDFSLPYFNSDQSVMIRQGTPITGAGGLAGRRVGALLGGTGEKWVKGKVPSADLRTYDLIDDAFKALAAGQIDAVINDFPSSKYAERSYRNLKVVATIPTGEYYGLAFKPGSPLRDQVNDTLRAMKKDGTFDRIYRSWFQVAPPATLLAETN